MAELYIGIIVGSAPPCRALFLNLWAKLNSKPDPLENTIGIKPGSGRGIILESLSKIGRVLTRSRSSPSGSMKESGSGWHNLETLKMGAKNPNKGQSSNQNLIDEEVGAGGNEITKTISITVMKDEDAVSHEVKSPNHRDW